MKRVRIILRFVGGRLFFLPLIFAGLIVGSTSHPCDVPVFRYALERWPPDVYEVLILHRGELSLEEKQSVDRILKAIDEGDLPVNCFLDLIDLNTEEGSKIASHLPDEEIGASPWVIVSLPTLKWSKGIVWSGPLSADTVRQVIDSPIRQEIAKEITGGSTGVWLLLESGHEENDRKGRDLLNTHLAELEKTLEVSKPVPIRSAAVTTTSDSSEKWEELPLSFPIIPVKRSDAAESFLVKMLLKCEPDLEGETYASMPMAFPVYGRGRVLYALVGPGITEGNIREACQFLTGPCSCEIKELNPGMDLLITADWENYEGDPLVDDFLGTSTATEAPTLAESNSTFFRNTIVSLVLVLSIVLAGSFFVLRRIER